METDKKRKSSSYVEEDIYTILPDEPEVLEKLENENFSRWLYFLHIMMGFSLLLPWNAFITAVDYFRLLFPADLSDKLPMVCGLVYNAPNLVCLILQVAYPLPSGLRVIGSYFIYLPFVALLPFMGEIGLSDNNAYILTLTMLGLSGIGAAMIQGAAFGIAGRVGPMYIQAVVLGNGLSGIVIGAARLATKGALPDTDHGLKQSALIYFAIAAGGLFIAFFCFLLLMKHPITVRKLSATSADVNALNILEDPDAVEAVKGSEVFKKLKLPAFGVFFVFAVTLSIFPGTVSEIKSHQWNDDWFSVMLVAQFCAADFIGRMFPGHFQPLFIKEKIWIPIVARIIYVPLLFLSYGSHEDALIKSDIYVYFVVFTMGLTNGYLGSLQMMYGAEYVEAREKKMAGTIMTLALVAGLCVGASVSALQSI